jgi:hypothetical protein
MSLFLDAGVLFGFTILCFFGEVNLSPVPAIACKLQPLFWTGLVMVLGLMYLVAQPFFERVVAFASPSPLLSSPSDEEGVFEVGEDYETDGIPAAPEVKSNVRIDTMDTKRMFSDLYGMGLGSFLLIYSVQSSHAFGNAMLCTSFLWVSGLAYYQVPLILIIWWFLEQDMAEICRAGACGQGMAQQATGAEVDGVARMCQERLRDVCAHADLVRHTSGLRVHTDRVCISYP